MENIKKYWNDNLSDKAKIIIVSFFTFFTFICASMTNSIVSAYSIDGIKGSYSNFIELDVPQSSGTCHIVCYYNGNANGLQKVHDVWYLTFNNNIIKDCAGYNWFTKGHINQKWSGQFPSSEYVDVVDNFSKYPVKSNDTSFIKYCTDLGNKNVKKVQTPLLTAKTVEGIAPAITKTMKVIIPVGLVIFGLILGIYLIKRLVALFL